MKILTVPNDVLNKPSKPVTTFDKKLAKTIKEMQKTLAETYDPVGVGLAAPQVGISKQLFIARPTEDSQPKTFINPKIIKQQAAKKESKKEKKLLEGCLSIPNIWGKVKRNQKLTLEYQDEKGNKHIEDFDGFMATIIQHEIDHLEGTLFTKHVVEQNEKLFRSHKNEDGEDEFDEIEI